MAANIFGLGNRPEDEDDIDSLLGIRKSQGMTDKSFAAAGRAPVNELWAGRYSAAIDDQEFAGREATANAVRDKALENKDAQIRNIMRNEGVGELQAETMWADMTRTRIADEANLDLYPGDLNATEDKPQFMQEFSDQGAGFRQGAFELLKENEGTGKAIRLGEVLQHPKFFEHYPEAQFMNIKNDSSYADENIYGSYNNHSWMEGYPEAQKDWREKAPLGMISLNPEMNEHDTMETVLHELQHYIQSVEGWENGASPSPELGRQYLEDQLSYAGEKGSAGVVAQNAQNVVDAADGLFDFQQIDNAAKDDGVNFEAYEATSGEELARAATKRWEDGIQESHYYLGSPTRWEEENWNQEEGDISPLDTTVQQRQQLERLGLLGVLDGKTIKKLLNMTGKEFEGYVGPYAGSKDGNLDQLKGLLEGAQ